MYTHRKWSWFLQTSVEADLQKKQRIDLTNLFYYPDIIVEKGKGVYEAMNSLVTLWLT